MKIPSVSSQVPRSAKYLGVIKMTCAERMPGNLQQGAEYNKDHGHKKGQCKESMLGSPD